MGAYTYMKSYATEFFSLAWQARIIRSTISYIVTVDFHPTSKLISSGLNLELFTSFGLTSDSSVRRFLRWLRDSAPKEHLIHFPSEWVLPVAIM